MQTIRGMWILLAVLLFSSVTFGGVNVPTGMAPHQAVVESVLNALDGTSSDSGRATSGSKRSNRGAAAPEQATTGDSAEAARLMQYVTLHKAQAWHVDAAFSR